MLLEIILAAVLVIAFITEVVLTETEHFGWATALLILCGAGCYYFNVYGAALWVKAHVAQTLIFVGIYLVAGVVWSFIKWFSYLVGYRERWREAKETDATNKAQWLSRVKDNLTKEWEEYGKELASYTEEVSKTLDTHSGYPRKPSPPRELLPQTEEAWNDYYEKHYHDYHKKATGFSKPLASDNKAKITAWMAFWPFSFLGTFINDPIRRLFNFIFSSFKKLYQQMSDHLFKDLVPVNKDEDEDN